MNKKIRTISVVIISIFILILVSIIIYNVIYLPNSIEKDNYPSIRNKNNLSTEIKTLEICAAGIDCGYIASEYTTITTTINSSTLENIITELNNKTTESYNKSLNATDMTLPECSSVSSIYSRNLMTQSNLILYDSDDILAFTLITKETNLCTLLNNEEIIVYFYDIKTDKILTEQELKERYNITDNEIATAVINNIEQKNIAESKLYTTNITEYHIYVERDGTIGVYYRQPEDNLFYNVLLNKHI